MSSATSKSHFFRRRFLPLLHLCFSKPPGHKGGKDDIVKELNTTHPVKRKPSLTWRYLQPSSALPDLHLCQIIPPTFGKVEKRLERVKSLERMKKSFERVNTEQVLKGILERFWKVVEDWKKIGKVLKSFEKGFERPSHPQLPKVPRSPPTKLSSPSPLLRPSPFWDNYEEVTV